MGSVSCAIVTRDRHEDLTNLLRSLSRQAEEIIEICIVDAGEQSFIKEKIGENVNYIRSKANLGGAGGYALAILVALASGADWIWLMDDDACPIDGTCLKNLLEAAHLYRLDAVSPLVVSPQDHNRLSFTFRIAGRITTDRSVVSSIPFIPNDAHLFNGLLVHKSVLSKIGLPDIRLFIRGDDVDYVLRMRQAGLRFGTFTGAAITHPPGWAEIVEGTGNNQILMPEGDFKKYYYFRNRGYIARRYKSIRRFYSDIIYYPYIFLILRKWDWTGFKFWAGAFLDGLKYKFDKAPK